VIGSGARLQAIALGLALVACESARPVEPPPPTPAETTVDRGWRIKTARERAKAVMWSKTTEQALVESKQLVAIDEDLQRALDTRKAATTMAARREADAALETIRTRIHEAFERAATIQRNARKEESRLEALPDRCFDGVPAADCKL
jgi:hypothetical protein